MAAPVPVQDEEVAAPTPRSATRTGAPGAGEHPGDGPGQPTPGRVGLLDAAAELGVHYQTVYRWVRSGALSATKRNGSYEVDATAVADLGRRRRSEVESPRPRRVRSFAPAANRLFSALVAGDETRAGELVDELAGAGVSLVDICDHVLAPALERTGEEWAAGRLTVAEEHRASAICARALGRWMRPAPGRPRGVIVVLGAPGDEHELPGVMATAVLRERHYRVHHLGTDVPDEDLERFLAGAAPDVVVITVTWPPVAEAAEQLAARLRAGGRCVLVGGPGATTAELLALV
jgi:methanogenic corrinoid protein MtbC1